MAGKGVPGLGNSLCNGSEAESRASPSGGNMGLGTEGETMHPPCKGLGGPNKAGETVCHAQADGIARP